MAKFIIEYRVRGMVTETVEADSKEAAEAIAQTNVEDEGWEPELDSIDDADFSVQIMHRVERDGKPVWTTYVRKTDVKLDDPTA
jgi:hypothetical protein